MRNEKISFDFAFIAFIRKRTSLPKSPNCPRADFQEVICEMENFFSFKQLKTQLCEEKNLIARKKHGSIATVIDFGPKI